MSSSNTNISGEDMNVPLSRSMRMSNTLESLRNLEPNIPGRQLHHDNTLERMTKLKDEATSLFNRPNNYVPIKEDYPMLYHEIPTLWAMIEEKKFSHTNINDQRMLLLMIQKTCAIVCGEITMQERDKELGDKLAQRYVYPLLNKNRR